MTTSTEKAAFDNKVQASKRDWHKTPSIQLFLKELAEGKALNEEAVAVAMPQACAEAVLSHIESKEVFFAMVKEYAPDQELSDGYDVYTLDRNDFFSANREVLLDFAKEDWVKKDRDMVEFLYRSIEFYGLGNITHKNIENAFFNNKTESENDADAWHMGCYAINNRALSCLLSAWGVRVGLIEPKPLTRRVTSSITVTEHNYDTPRLHFVSDQLSNSPELLDTHVMAGNMTLLCIKGSNIKAFTDDFHALTAKYAI